MSLRFHEIAESGHRVLNPFSEEKLDLLGEITRVGENTRLLDLACGKGELLCRWAAAHRITGLGVDISEVFLAAARERAAELRVTDRVTFLNREAGAYLREQSEVYDVVSCLGATWIGGGLVGTVKLMLPALKDDGILLIGEPYWEDEPPREALELLGYGREDFGTLGETLDRFQACGLELLEMVMADLDGWDRYMASQWWAVSDWLAANPDDPDAPRFREILDGARRFHLNYGRRYFGWGVFVLRRAR